MERHLCDFFINRWYCVSRLAHPPCTEKGQDVNSCDTSHAIEEVEMAVGTDVTSPPIRVRTSKCMVWAKQNIENISAFPISWNVDHL